MRGEGARGVGHISPYVSYKPDGMNGSFGSARYIPIPGKQNEVSGFVVRKNVDPVFIVGFWLLLLSSSGTFRTSDAKVPLYLQGYLAHGRIRLTALSFNVNKEIATRKSLLSTLVTNENKFIFATICCPPTQVSHSPNI